MIQQTTIPMGAPAVPKTEAAVATVKPAVDERTLHHRQLLDGPFWHQIPAYREISDAQFLDHRWQAKHSITNVPKLLAALEGLVSAEFIIRRPFISCRPPMERYSPG